MPFDGIVTANVAFELDSLLAGGRIDKIYQPDSDEIVLAVHRGKDKRKIFMTSNSGDARVQLAPETPPNPQSPPAFCMLMRKHLGGAKINTIIQKDSERIIEFCIDSFNELGYPTTKKVIVEIMGKHSNISLIDADKGKILDSVKKISFDVNRYRQLLPGMPYVYPPSQDKVPFREVTGEDLRRIIADSVKPVSKAVMGGISGFSGFAASALCSRAGVDGDRGCSSLSEEEISLLEAELLNTVSRIEKGDFEPCVWVAEDGSPVDFHSFDHPDYSSGYKKIAFDSIGEAEEFYYSTKRSTNRIRQRSTDLEKVLKAALDKLYLKKARLGEDILQAEGCDEFSLRGELLFASLHKIRQGASSVTLENYYNGEEIEIALDPKLSPSENAQKYYKKYNKMKTALVEKSVQMDETDKEIAYLESVSQLLENASDFNDVADIRLELINGGYIKRRGVPKKAKESAAPPHRFTSSEGFRIFAGRNNVQNDKLTLKTAGSKDLWFHTKDIPGTHVILFTEGREPSETSLFEAASIAAYYSKGKQSENVPVDYCLVKYVRKPNGAKPGMVIFDHNKTLYVNPKLPDTKVDETD